MSGYCSSIIPFLCCINHTILLVRSETYWQKKNLTWGITKSSTLLDDVTVAAAMRAAFAKWADVSPFDFTQARLNVEVCAQIEKVN